ncbi:hypothetical protein E4T43_09425 [Aureobasidium subglaciale]|nr:hypothetical protein E4T43_09425 [Aureobasidium subglaciale]
MEATPDLSSLTLQCSPELMTPVALSLPDIVSHVFSFLRQDRKTLRAAACVTELWFQEATRLLWTVAGSQVLVAVKDRRRNLYAPKISRLTLQSVNSHEHLRHCQFTALRILVFSGGPRNVDSDLLCQYLHPGLEEVYFTSLPPDHFLDGLNQQCPRLRVFHQGTNSFALSLACEPEAAALLQALSSIASLEYLAILGETSEKHLTELQGLTLGSRTFASVNRLELTIGVSAISSLSITFSALKSLCLDVVIRPGNYILDTLAELPLETLQLHVITGAELSSRELIFLHKSSNLRSLVIKPMPWRPGGRIAKFESSNNDFRYIFSKLSKLEKLLIWFELDIPDPDAALIDLGQSCPRLENLRIYSSIDLTEWESVPAPLFPSLKFAWIASVNDDQLIEEPNESVAQALAVLIDQQAPKLDRFVALNSYAFRPTDANELSKLVMRAHGRIREINQTRHAKEDSLDLAAR